MNITWKIDSLEIKPQIESFQDVIYTAHWRVYARDGDVVTSVYGSVTFPFDSSSTNFIPYEELSEETVIKWVKNTMGIDQVESIENNAVYNLQQLMEPPTVTKPLPWST